MCSSYYSARRAHTAARIAASIRLPQTTFPRRSTPADTHRLVPRISSELYARVSQSSECTPIDSGAFVIHDGPPFANGRLHIGHALNKLAKDALMRSHAARGRRVALIPAWDCHGLPIEVRALSKHFSQSATARKAAQPTDDPSALLATCRAFASEAMAGQYAQMRSWGLLADADKSLRTMDPAYEAAELRVLARIVRRNLLSARRQPVLWSPSSRTALAEAEIVYSESTDAACLVAYALKGSDARLLVWTTTPWTLFANEGVAFSKSMAYFAVRLNGARYVVAETRLAFVLDTLSCPDANVDGPFVLCEGMEYTCGINGTRRPVVASDHVTADTGTGLVHCAPSFGAEDHALWQSLLRRGAIDAPLKPFQETVDDNGCLTHAAGHHLAGTSIFDTSVLDALRKTGAIVHTHTYTHRVPCDWRTGGRVIERATRQWFLDVAAVRPALRTALREVRFVPDSGRVRLDNMLGGRDAWCVSRQRRWGLPIPVFYRAAPGAVHPPIAEETQPLPSAWTANADGDYVLTPEVVDHIANVFEKHGSAAWWSLPTVDLLPAHLRPLAPMLERGTDTLDVWFDSGCLWAAMPPQLHTADVYVEGTDQFRGWFQASLITAACAHATTAALPTRAIVAHGFVLDAGGTKMSKSVGNVVAPEDVAAKYGLDVLRLWAAAGLAGDAEDVVLCDAQLGRIAASLARTRNTMAFLLGNVNGYAPSAVSLRPIDAWAVESARRMAHEAYARYDAFDLRGAYDVVTSWLRDVLSAFYIDAVRDRLYVGDECARAGAQHGLWAALNAAVHVLDPIAPLLCAELREHAPSSTLHAFGTYTAMPTADSNDYARIEAVRAFRSELMAAGLGRTGHPQARLVLVVDNSVSCGLSPSDTAEALSVGFVVSAAAANDFSGTPFGLPHVGRIGQADAYLLPGEHRCVRCQRYHVGPEHVPGSICSPCDRIVASFQL